MHVAYVLNVVPKSAQQTARRTIAAVDTKRRSPHDSSETSHPQMLR